MEEEKGTQTSSERSPSPMQLLIHARTVHVGTFRGGLIEPIVISKNGLGFFIEGEKNSHKFHIYPQEIRQCLVRFDDQSLLFFLTSQSCGVRTRTDLGIPHHSNPALPPPEPYFDPDSGSTSQQLGRTTDLLQARLPHMKNPNPDGEITHSGEELNRTHQMITVMLDALEKETQVEMQKYMEHFESLVKQEDEAFYLELSAEEAQTIFKQSTKGTPNQQLSLALPAVTGDQQHSQAGEEGRNSNSPTPPREDFAGSIIKVELQSPWENQTELKLFQFHQGGGDAEARENSILIEKDLKRKMAQKQYDKTKRKRSVQDEWLKQYQWLGFDEDDSDMHCKVCRQFPSLSDSSSTLVKGITSNFRKETLKFHEKSKKHQMCMSKMNAENPASASFQKAHEQNSEIHEYECLFNTAYYVAIEGESFLEYPELLNLQEMNGLAIGPNYRTDKACQEFCVCCAEVLKDDVKADLTSTRFFSILSNGSTDKGLREQELVFVRYVDSEGNVQTKLADVVELVHGHATGIKEGILKGMETVGVDLKALTQKLVGINTDGATVNVGKKGGAAKLLIDSINKQIRGDCSKYIAVMHCVQQDLELAVCDSKKECEYLSDFERTLKGIFQLYYYSPKKRRELFEIAANLDEELKHYGGIQQIRWVASQNRALKALFDNYEVTVSHLQEVASGKEGNSNKANGYLKTLTTEKFLILLHFMLDWTSLLGEVSTVLREKKCIISEVSTRISELKQKFSLMKTRRGKHLRHFLGEKETGEFKGIEITQSAVRRDQESEDSTRILADINDLLNSTELFIEERFIKHIGGEPHSLFHVFDFNRWPESMEELREYGQEEVDALLALYPERILRAEEKEEASEQWIDLKMYMKRIPHKSVIDGYKKALKSNDTGHLRQILLLVRIMLSVSPSMAECETGFSQMNLIKTNRRTVLQYDSLSSLVRIKCDGPLLKEFNPTPAVSKWLNSSKRGRHSSGHKLPTPRARPRRIIEVLCTDSE